MTNWTISNFNELKIMTQYGVETNDYNGATDHGYAIHFESFKGDVTIQNCM